MPTTSAQRAFEFTSLSTMVGAIDAFIATLPAGKKIEACQLTMSCCDALLTSAAAKFVPANGDTRAAERGLSSRKSSKSATRRAAKRAAAAQTCGHRSRNRTGTKNQADVCGRSARPRSAFTSCIAVRRCTWPGAS